MEIKSYAMYSRDDTIRSQSSSGAFFFEFAKKIICDGGIVYGVAMSKDKKYAEYVRVNNMENLFQLLGSKYMQAKIGRSFESVKNDLESGKYVLFSGTGCCINGLKSYLKHEYENLFCLEIICKGVPSPKLWKKYTDYLEDKFQMKIFDVKFRYKPQYSRNSINEEQFRQFFSISKYDPYFSMFMRNYCLRPSCYNCIAKKNHNSDVTMGDFWGIDNIVPEINDKKGVSLIIVRTNKGLDKITQIFDCMITKEVNYYDAIQYNPAENQSIGKPKERDFFFNDLENLSFTALLDKYVYRDTKGKIKKILLNTPLKNIFQIIKNCKTDLAYGLMIIFKRN